MSTQATVAHTNIRTDSRRRDRQVYNRTKYRMTKRRNLWVRSLAAAKNPEKITVLTAKIEAMTLALEMLESA